MDKRKKVVIFGAGIAGLSCAHSLNKSGYNVTVIESLGVPGGLARSERLQEDNYKKERPTSGKKERPTSGKKERPTSGQPSEYSWRGFGPWYNNIFKIMKEIPDESGSGNLYNSEFTHPIKFYLLPDKVDKKINFDNYDLIDRFLMTSVDKVKLSWILLRAWCASDDRSKNEYTTQKASTILSKYLTIPASKTICSTFGPWIGSDYSRVSYYHCASFFSKNAFPNHTHIHPKNDQRPGFTHGSNSGWLTLKKPINESWFDPWVEYLKYNGVQFKFNTSLEKLNTDNNNEITSAEISNNGSYKIIVFDYYVLAVNPYITKNIINKSSNNIKNDPELKKFKGLTKDKEHIQISFRLSFSELIKFPKTETAIILTDSEYDITFCGQSQLWNGINNNIYLGPNVRTLWSGTATLSDKPGKLYGLSMAYVTKEQFINEIKYQIYKCKNLNQMVKHSNNNKSLESFELLNIEVWHTWEFPLKNNKKRITNKEPKWVNNIHNYKYQPNSKTSIPNLFLAGAHTKTSADLYSMEAAAESGIIVNDLISNQKTVISQTVPWIFQIFKMIDIIFYYLNLPNFFDILVIILPIVLFYYCFSDRDTVLVLIFIYIVSLLTTILVNNNKHKLLF